MNKSWAFGMMRKGPSYLSRINGIEFFKLMGSGKELGSPTPNWSVYALLQVWENEALALEFFKKSELMAKFRERTKEQATFFLKCMVSNGLWSGLEPFNSSVSLNDELPIAVLTRATIKTRFLLKFWKQAKKAQKPFLDAKGLLLSKGVGEVPIRQMATFSIWEDIESLKNVAYKQTEHRKAIQMTRKINWYSEELFARFKLYQMQGTWGNISEILIQKGVAYT